MDSPRKTRKDAAKGRWHVAFRALLPPVLIFCWWAVAAVRAEDDPNRWRARVASGELVEVASLDPSLVIELRYATVRNGAGGALYPSGFPCLLRPEVARKLLFAQRLLRDRGLGLKVWDAYRPMAAQRELWRRVGRQRYVADPDAGSGSMHTRGVAVDVTLVDLATGRELPMPTDFDQFSLDAVGIYRGPDPVVRENLRRLHRVMVAAGFLAQYREWWHFTDRAWRQHAPLD